MRKEKAPRNVFIVGFKDNQVKLKGSLLYAIYMATGWF